jgi:hypothetical protein
MRCDREATTEGRQILAARMPCLTTDLKIFSGAADHQGMNKITAGLITLSLLAPVATAQASPYRHPPVAQTSAKKCYKRIIHRHGAIEKRRVKCPKAATSKATWSSVAAPSGAKW